MAERTFVDSGLRQGLEYLPAPDDSEGQEAGVAQPGQLYPGPIDPQALRIERAKETDGINSIDQASDTFAVVTMVAGQDKAYQLLPVGPNRKSAIIMCFGNPIVLGDQGAISNVVPGTIPGGTLGVFALPPSTLTVTPALFVITYTSKRSLWVACAVAGQTAQVQCLVEKFNSGVPVT